MKLLPWASGAFFRSLEAADAWLGLPEKLAESLAFRKDWRTWLKPHRSEGAALWIHGASVGELEDLADFFLNQDRLREAGYDLDQVVLTAASVSARSRLQGWSQKYPLRYAGPLPPEKSAEVDAFLAAVEPNLQVLSHSDIWPLLLERARPRLARGLVWLPARRSTAKALAPRSLAPLLTHVGSRAPEDVEHWESLLPGIESSFIGNPRIDRIVARIEAAQGAEDHALAAHQAEPEPDRVSVILGSAWIEDADVWAEALALLPEAERLRFQLVVLPHQSDDPHMVASIQHRLPQARILPLQGVLLEAYSRFTLAYVGGGFRTGLHNILEPALWGTPVICGPRLDKQPEAPGLVSEGQLRCVGDAAGLAEVLASALDPVQLLDWKSRSTRGAQQLRAAQGASQRLAKLLARLKTHR